MSLETVASLAVLGALVILGAMMYRRPPPTGTTAMGLAPLNEDTMLQLIGDEAAIEAYLWDGPPPTIPSLTPQSDHPAAVAEPARRNAVYFKQGEPRTFEQYGGQPHVTRYLAACIAGITGAADFRIAPQVFTGSAGGGKTLLAKVTTNQLNIKAMELGLPPVDFIEVFSNDVPDVAALDGYMRRVQENPGCVFFLDELHSIVGQRHWDKFLLVLEEQRYLFEGERYPVQLPPFTVLAATTDFGTLHEAWRRRFNPHTFVPATREQLLAYVRRRGPISRAAAEAIVERVHFGGAPWEALWVFETAKVFARARRATRVQVRDVEEVWEVNQIDDMGLRPVDRQVIKALFSQPRYRRSRADGELEFVCYAASEANTYQMARVDRGEYQDFIRPKLMSRGLLEIKISYGQALTPRCVELYSSLREANV